MSGHVLQLSHCRGRLCIGCPYQCPIRTGLHAAEQSEVHKTEPLLCEGACQTHHRWGDKVCSDLTHLPLQPMELQRLLGAIEVKRVPSLLKEKPTLAGGT